jgi:hypothetical protein
LALWGLGILLFVQVFHRPVSGPTERFRTEAIQFELFEDRRFDFSEAKVTAIRAGVM